MQDVPLFTTIPPAMSRPLPDGSDGGRAYQTACITSWHEAGFRPVTVNAASERIDDALENAPPVGRVATRRDARAYSGKPLVYLSDFLSEIAARTDGPVAISNADIRLRPGNSLARAIRTLGPGECAILPRTEIVRPDDTEGHTYTHGFDFFAVHASDLRAIDPGPFVLGLPWWDHWLPIQLFLRGVRRRDLVPPGAVLHLDHDDRWDTRLWLDLGDRFRDLVRARAGDLPAEYIEVLDRPYPGDVNRAMPRIRHRVRMLTQRGRERTRYKSLMALSHANVGLIRNGMPADA